MEICSILEGLNIRRLEELLKKLEETKEKVRTGDLTREDFKDVTDLAVKEIQRIIVFAAELDEEDRRLKKLGSYFQEVRDLGPIER